MAQLQPTPQTRAESASLVLEEIKRRVRLPPNVTAQDAIQAVMCTFSQHVSGGEARRVWGVLPQALQPLLERCMIHREEPAERFGRDALLLRVSQHLGVSVQEAEATTSAVLHAISSRLPAKQLAEAAAQLPQELRDLWLTFKVPVGAPIEPHPILSRIEKSVKLPSGVTGIGAFRAAIGHLSRRLSLGEAHHLVATMPTDLRQLVEDCVVARGEHPEHFNKAQYLERMAKDLKTEPNEAEKIARAVFRSLDEHVPAVTFRHVATQLPRELSDMWLLP